MHLKTIAAAGTAVVALALPATALADYGHVTQRGESLTSIAATDGLSVGALAAANGLSPDSELTVGQVVEIPPRGAAETATAATTGTASSTATASGAADTSAGAGSGAYVVQPGDTLSGIAARIGTSVAELAALNGLRLTGVLLSGSRLALPGGSASAATAASEGPATGPGNQQIAGDTSSGPYPTDQYVSSSEVGAEASADGVSPSLAEAIGYQESGYDNDLVSSAGAVGVMQIEPATWSWINQELVADGELSPSSAYDNVAGGVLLLRDLVAQTGSDTEASAAYYQGLESVREHGMYPSTEQYVRDVAALQARFGG